MSHNITNLSIVLVGSGFSPSIFNGNVFAENEVIPSNWNWKVTNSGTTQLVSQVDYNLSYFSIRTERNRISFFDNAIKEKPEKSKIIEIAKRFVEKYKHLNFLGIGVNFESVLEVDNGDKYLLDKFISKSIKSDKRLISASTNLFYKIDEDSILRNNIEAGILEREFVDGTISKQEGLVVKSNIHRNIPSDNQIEFIKNSLKKISADWSMLDEITQSYIK